ncbi:MAG: DNA primase, partial [Proteobacteria bacterium]|nr:DNA primase [Pseudomonadota bacterium]
CHGCQEWGDVFKFLMKLEGLTFVEAVKELAGPAGISVPERELTSAERQSLRQRSRLLELLQLATNIYASCLWTHQAGQKGRTYLKQRGLEEQIARQANLGFAPESWTWLLELPPTKRGFTRTML